MKHLIEKILADTACARYGGSKEEHACADYLCNLVGGRKEAFSLPVDTVQKARVLADGKELPCRAYRNTGCGQVRGPLYYLPYIDDFTLEQCRGAVVLLDGAVGPKTYRRLVEHGALGILSCYGDVRLPHRDLDDREVRWLTAEEPRIPALVIHAEDAVSLVANRCSEVELILEQQREEGVSYNVLLELPGERDEWVVFSAHYDSTALSHGAYDNMSGCIALVQLAKELAKVPRRCGVRFLWCGAEERGLLGSAAYCEAHRAESEKWLLNINLDMLGSVMGNFVGFSCADEKTLHYLTAFAAEKGYPMEGRLKIRSSDSNSFVRIGVPAVSFARYAPGSTAAIHERYDTAALVDAERLEADTAFIEGLTRRLVTSARFPLDRAVCPKVQEEIDRYFKR